MDSFDKEQLRMINIHLRTIADELKVANELKEVELEMRKYWITSKRNEWKFEK